MGYKVTNKNIMINHKENIVMDNVFFFQTREQAEEYVIARKTFYDSRKPKIGTEEMIIEECTDEENEKYVFDQYHESINPNDLKLPNLVIERPLKVLKGVPYWVTRRELLIEN